MCSINSLGIKLGNTNCRLACASISEWSSLSVNCLNGIDEQFTTKTLFTIKANAEYSGGFEQCLASADEFNPSNVVFDALNLKNSKSICYSDEEFGSIFAKKRHNGEYKLEFYGENDRQQQSVEYKDIEVIAGILSKLMEAAKEQLPEKGTELRQLVITIPSLAEYEYREKMLKAVKILGLENIEVQLMAQMTAAAIAYRHKEDDSSQGNVLFFYMGARNTEFAIYKFMDGLTPELCFADGFVDFGGDNFTAQLVQRQMEELKLEMPEIWRNMGKEEKRTVYRNVRMAMERIKAQLGCKDSATVKMDLGPTLHGRAFTITREKFEEICKEQCEQIASFLIERLNHFNERVNRIVLIGESSKLYLVQNLFCQYSTNEKMLPMNALPPLLAAVQGAAIKAAYEAFGKSGNAMPKCLTKAIVPNYAFRGIYGKISSFLSSNLPCYLVQFGQQIPTRNIQIQTLVDIGWQENDANGKNEKEIMNMGYQEYFAKIDINGLLQFELDEGLILCFKDVELQSSINKFKQYELDVMRVKREQIEWEESRKEEKRLNAQQKQKELEEKKKQQKEEAKKARELANKRKLDEESEKKANELKLKWTKEQEEKKNYRTIETKMEVVDEGNEQKKSENLENDVVEDSFEVVPPAVSNDYNHIYVFIEIPNRHKRTLIYIKGSWDNWKDMIPMKYSQFTNSFLIVLPLPLSKDEYEFLFLYENMFYLWKNWFDEKFAKRIPRTLKGEYRHVNFIKLNSTTQIGNQNSSSPQELVEKLLIADNSMDQLVNRMKNSREFSDQYINKMKQKYLEIRSTLSTQIKPQEVEILIDEADRVLTYLEIIFFVFEWDKLMNGHPAFKKNGNAEKIRNFFIYKLKQLTMSKEEAIQQFKCTFCCQLLEECRRIGLGEISTEIQQLKTFMESDFSHNNLRTGTSAAE